MGLDSIYAMLARPVQAFTNRRRNVNKVTLSDEIHADSHEAPQSQLPPSDLAMPKTRIKPNFIKANNKLSTSKPVDNLDQEEVILPNGEHIKHIDIEV
jgi:hypothetical protein